MLIREKQLSVESEKMGYRVKGDREKRAAVVMCEKHLSKELDKEGKRREKSE